MQEPNPEPEMHTFYKVDSPMHGPIIPFQGCLDPEDWCTLNTPLQHDVGSLGDDIFESYDQAANSVITNVQIEVGRLQNSIEQHTQAINIANREIKELELRLTTFKANGVPKGGYHLSKKNEG